MKAHIRSFGIQYVYVVFRYVHVLQKKFIFYFEFIQAERALPLPNLTTYRRIGFALNPAQHQTTLIRLEFDPCTRSVD